MTDAEEAGNCIQAAKPALSTGKRRHDQGRVSDAQAHGHEQARDQAAKASKPEERRHGQRAPAQERGAAGQRKRRSNSIVGLSVMSIILLVTR